MSAPETPQETPDRLEEMAERIGIWWEGHNEGARKQLAKYVLKALHEARANERAALKQIEREVGNPSDVLLLRIRSIARAALAQPEAAPKGEGLGMSGHLLVVPEEERVCYCGHGSDSHTPDCDLCGACPAFVLRDTGLRGE